MWLVSLRDPQNCMGKLYASRHEISKHNPELFKWVWRLFGDSQIVQDRRCRGLVSKRERTGPKQHHVRMPAADIMLMSVWYLSIPPRSCTLPSWKCTPVIIEKQVQTDEGETQGNTLGSA